jgi:aryl-alcohol dehydrogenase-like predicted oxidoreductase
MASCPAKKHARASRRVLAGGALCGSAERHPIASPPPEPIGSAMSYHADLVRAFRLMPLVKEGFAASLTEAATRFAISHPVMGTILVGMATPLQFEDALAAVQKGPLPHAALERLTALQQGIRRRDTVIVEICRASPVNGPQAPTRRAFTPALGSGRRRFRAAAS